MDTYGTVKAMALAWFDWNVISGLTGAELFLAIRDVVRQINNCGLFDNHCLDHDGQLQLTLDLYEHYRPLV